MLQYIKIGDSMPKDLIIDSAIKYFKDHPTIGSFFLYLLGSFIGMLYELFLLAQFNIYVFHYTKIYEYFLFAFKAYGITIFIVFYLLLVVLLLYRLPKTLRSKFVINTSIVILIIVLMGGTYLLANYTATNISNNDDRIVKVLLQNKFETSKTNSYSLSLISTSESFAFFYNKKTKKSLVIPFNNILLIQYK